MRRQITIMIISFFIASCNSNEENNSQNSPSNSKVLSEAEKQALPRIKPLYVTDKVPHDTDDPAIWINPEDASNSLVIGTDKKTNGGLYVFDMQGRLIPEKCITPLDRPNNVDVAYGFTLSNTKTDIVVTTERNTKMIRIFSLPDMKPLDNGGIRVFEDEEHSSPMGIALYHQVSTGKMFAIVGRKDGPKNGYLWQYELKDNGSGMVEAKFVRAFGEFSGLKEIEAIAVDKHLGYVYYSDEQFGVRKYHADPVKGNKELARFATTGFSGDHEGISIYYLNETEGYILVSDQQADCFHVFLREGDSEDPHHHKLQKIVRTSTLDSDGSELVSTPILPDFPNGLFVAMSTDKTFHYYPWENIAGNELRKAN